MWLTIVIFSVILLVVNVGSTHDFGKMWDDFWKND
jgi:hypothetical protein